MKTTFIVQKRFPHLSRKSDARRQWHDNPEVEKNLSLPDAIRECKLLQDESESSEHRVIKRVEETIFTANGRVKESE